MSEYRIGSPFRAVIGVIASIILLICIPQAILNILRDPFWLEDILANIGMSFDASGIADMLSNFDTTGMQAMIERAIISAIPLVALAFPYKFYDDGNKGKMYCGVVRSLYCVGRYVYIMNFGNLAGIFSVQMDSTTVSFDMILTGALLVSIFLRLIRIPKYLAIYKDEREDYVDFHIVDGRWVNRSKKEVKRLKKEKRESEKKDRRMEKAELKDKVREANGMKPKYSEKVRGKDDNGKDDDR
jgi:hypothetical protein